MLGVERRQYIFNLIQDRGSITVSELSQLCLVGEETIRRDLNKMASEDLIEKIYGGATIKETMHRVIPVSVRKSINVEEKKRIARCCSSMIEEGDTIFLDGSTTALEIANELKNIPYLIVITNAAEVACRLTDNPGHKVICTGGTMRLRTSTFVGHSSVTVVGQYYADKAFIGCDGLDMITGITDANEQEADVRKAMLRQSKIGILVSDNSKFDKTSFASIGDFNKIQMLVTDTSLSEMWINFLQSKDVEYKICEDLNE